MAHDVSLTFFRSLGFEVEDREDNGVLLGAMKRVQ